MRNDPFFPDHHFDRDFSRTADVMGPGVDEHAREKALLRTADLARKIAQIARTSELPDEAIPCLFEAYKSEVIQVVCEARAPTITNRVPLRIDSGDQKILAGQVAMISTRAAGREYRVEEIHIEGDPSRWEIRGLDIGTKSQFANYSPMPIRGERFADVLKELRLDPCYAGMIINLTVAYVGPEPHGEVFQAIATGTQGR